MAGRIRTFVAVGLPELHREALARHLADCSRRAPAFRWVEPDALHLTLRFIGHVELETLERVRDELAAVRAAPFGMALDGHGTFGSRSAARVVWLGVREGQDACAALAERVESACTAAGLEPDPRRFRAHVTLARAPTPRNPHPRVPPAEPGGWSPAISWGPRARTEGERLPPLPEPPRLERWVVDDFVLYESRLRQQPRYVALERYPLSD